jgi:hypothetical protein
MPLNCGQQQAYYLSPRLYMSMESHGGTTLRGENRRPRRETCPNGTLTTTNPIWTDTGENSCLRGEMPATNILSHGIALKNTSLLQNIHLTLYGRHYCKAHEMCNLFLSLDARKVQEFGPVWA